MFFTKRIGSKGELTIPRCVRDDWKLKPGEELIIEKIGGEMVIKKPGQPQNH